MKIIVLDTETLGVHDSRVYDLGYVIADLKTGEILKSRDYISKEIYDNPNLMNTAYYANKMPIYEERLENGYCKRVRWCDACRMLSRDIKKYGVNELYAYNSQFDTRAIATTCQALGVKTNPVANGIIDIWKGITDPHITETKEYKDFCKANGFMTRHKKPKCQAKAETVFRYLTNNTNYLEEHTALEDSKIELEILMFALAKMRG